MIVFFSPTQLWELMCSPLCFSFPCILSKKVVPSAETKAKQQTWVN